MWIGGGLNTRPIKHDGINGEPKRIDGEPRRIDAERNGKRSRHGRRSGGLRRIGAEPGGRATTQARR